MENIAETTFLPLKVYPNPAIYFYIDLNEKQFLKDSKLKIWNIQAEIMYVTTLHSAQGEISLNNLSDGLNLIKVLNGEQIFISSLIVQEIE